MITNDRQYRITKEEAARFEQALAQAGEQGADLHPRLRQAIRESLESELEILREQLAEYEALRSGQVAVLELDSLKALPDALIRARIAAGLTQKELAKRLGLKEQQIQRYEATRYAGEGLGRRWLRQIERRLLLVQGEEAEVPTGDGRACCSGGVEGAGVVGVIRVVSAIDYATSRIYCLSFPQAGAPCRARRFSARSAMSSAFPRFHREQATAASGMRTHPWPPKATGPASRQSRRHHQKQRESKRPRGRSTPVAAHAQEQETSLLNLLSGPEAHSQTSLGSCACLPAASGRHLLSLACQTWEGIPGPRTV